MNTTSLIPFGKAQNDLFWFPGKTYTKDDIFFAGRKEKREATISDQERYRIIEGEDQFRFLGVNDDPFQENKGEMPLISFPELEKLFGGKISFTPDTGIAEVTLPFYPEVELPKKHGHKRSDGQDLTPNHRIEDPTPRLFVIG